MNSNPIIGDAFYLLETKDTPEKFHDTSFGERGWFIAWIAWYPILVAFKPRVVNAILEKKFYDRGWPSKVVGIQMDNLVSSSDDKWKVRRSLINPSFNLNVIQSYVPKAIINMQNLVKDIRKYNGKDVDFHGLLSEHIITLILETTVGLEKGEDQKAKDTLLDIAKKYFTIQSESIDNPIWILTDILSRLYQGAKLLNEGKKVISELIKPRLEDRQSDEFEHSHDASKSKNIPFLDQLIDAFVVGSRNMKRKINMRELLDETISLGGASYETTANTSTWTLFHLACYPECQEKLYQELKCFEETDTNMTVAQIENFPYLDQCLKENMRIFPPVSFTTRVVQEDLQLDEFIVPKGIQAYISIHGAQRDEKIFELPEKFDPERFSPENMTKLPPGSYVPFGYGPMRCIGERLALCISKIIVATVVKNFELIPVDKENVEYSLDVTPRPKKALSLGRPSVNSTSELLVCSEKFRESLVGKGSMAASGLDGSVQFTSSKEYLECLVKAISGQSSIKSAGPPHLQRFNSTDTFNGLGSLVLPAQVKELIGLVSFAYCLYECSEMSGDLNRYACQLACIAEIANS
ncbi:cytochrome P450 4C1-like [Brevipalpus obovatus]|uniref:cytochrome P450 4C1-like n=1 Tax=Brevipalpus obovatus TaxID=246614 RepID=UPI003D9EC349